MVTVGDGETGYVTGICMVEDGEGCSYETIADLNINMASFTHDISSTGADMLTIGFDSTD